MTRASVRACQARRPPGDESEWRMATELLDHLRGKLIVSCQAGPDEPLHGASIMAAMARAAQAGGAAAIRANGPDDIRAIRAAVALPIIGIYKRDYPDSEVYITPTQADAEAVASAGADMIALDGTPRPRPGGLRLDDLIRYIHDSLRLPVMADISCLEDARCAQQAGADVLATTLSGYTAHGRPARPGPDLDLIGELAQQTRLPVIAEGRFFDPAQVADALARGALAVVVGGAITRPQEITRRFIQALAQRG